VPSLQRARGAVVTDQARTVLYEEPGENDLSERDVGRNRKASWNKGPRLEEATASEEGEDIWQDLQEGSRAGDREAKARAFSRVFH
jgi:hypothetical protein